MLTSTDLRLLLNNQFQKRALEEYKASVLPELIRPLSTIATQEKERYLISGLKIDFSTLSQPATEYLQKKLERQKLLEDAKVQTLPITSISTPNIDTGELKMLEEVRDTLRKRENALSEEMAQINIQTMSVETKIQILIDSSASSTPSKESKLKEYEKQLQELQNSRLGVMREMEDINKELSQINVKIQDLSKSLSSDVLLAGAPNPEYKAPTEPNTYVPNWLTSVEMLGWFKEIAKQNPQYMRFKKYVQGYGLKENTKVSNIKQMFQDGKIRIDKNVRTVDDDAGNERTQVIFIENNDEALLKAYIRYRKETD